MRDVNFMSPEEFRRLGYLQEVNRMLLHPLGLALSVEMGEDGEWCLGPIWDCRDDPEGLIFGDDNLDGKKAELVKVAWGDRFDGRWKAFGFMTQPCEGSGAAQREAC